MQTRYNEGPQATSPAIVPFSLRASRDGRSLSIFSPKIIEPSRVNALVHGVLAGSVGVKFTPIAIDMRPVDATSEASTYVPGLWGRIEFSSPRTREQLRGLVYQLQNQFTAEPDLRLDLDESP